MGNCKNGKGVHGNDSCVQCGACCYLYQIDEKHIPEESLFLIGEPPTRVFKRQREPCPNLVFNTETRKASCRAYDGNRPTACKTFGCYNGLDNPKDATLLREAAQNLGRYLTASS